MADLKLDLLKKLTDDKMFEELELIRLAGEPNMNYRSKIENMQYQLRQIALLNVEIELVNQYFQPQQSVAQQPASAPAPMGQVHQGQTHGE